MAKDPAFLFYPNDFLSGTQFLTDDQVGKYIRLLLAQHQHGHLTEKQVLFICKSYDNDILIKFKKDDNGLYYNERLEEEIIKRKRYTESRSNNKSGRKKAANEVLENNHTEIISKSYQDDMVNENRNINSNNIPIKSNKEIGVNADKSASLSVNLKSREKKFMAELSPYVSTYGKEMIRTFFDYWIEPNKSKTKMRYELEKTWDLSKRLSRWASNEKATTNRKQKAVVDHSENINFLTEGL